MDGNQDLIRVSASSHPALVAGSIAKAVRSKRQAVIRAIGAAAVHQAVKSIAVAVSYLAQDGIKAAFVPEFSATEIDGNYRTAISFVVHIVSGPPG